MILALPSDSMAIVRSFLSPAINAMLSRTCRSLRGDTSHRLSQLELVEDLSSLRYMRCSCFGCHWKAMAAAARGGYIDSLQWLLPPHVDVHIERMICEEASRGGHIPMLEWLPTAGYRTCCMSSLAAASEGKLEAVEWIWDRRGRHGIFSIGWNAAEGGHINVLEWCVSRGLDDPCIAEAAAANGYVNVLEWLMERGVSLNHRNVYAAAAECEHIEVFEWMLSHGFPPPDAGLMDRITRDKRLELVKWLTNHLPH